MKRPVYHLAVVLALGGALLSGCATGPRAGKKTARPGQPSSETKSAARGDEFSDEAMERRIKATAHFAAGISAELNGEDNAALQHYLKSAAADPGHEVLIVELVRRFL